MRAFLCECKKTKGKLLTVLLPVLFFILLWVGWIDSGRDAAALRDFYTASTIDLLELNGIFLPVSLAVMASRLMDLETKGNTLKLLCTIQPKSGIFLHKFLLAALHLFFFFSLETAGIRLLGAALRVTQPFPALDYLRLEGAAFLTSLLILLLQFFLSLRLENQLYPLFAGLVGSFVGLFSMVLPLDNLWHFLLPWTYFLIGASVTMGYNEVTQEISYPRVPFDARGFLLLLALSAAAFLAVRRAFLKKEV